jgi:hypothetical protein
MKKAFIDGFRAHPRVSCDRNISDTLWSIVSSAVSSKTEEQLEWILYNSRIYITSKQI